MTNNPKGEEIKIVTSPRIDWCGACKSEHGYDCPLDTPHKGEKTKKIANEIIGKYRKTFKDLAEYDKLGEKSMEQRFERVFGYFEVPPLCLYLSLEEILAFVRLEKELSRKEERQFFLNILDGIDMADEQMGNKRGGTKAIRKCLEDRVI